MPKIFTVVVSLALFVGVAVSPVWAVGDKVRGDKATGPAGTTGGGEAEPNRGEAVGPNNQSLDALTDAEIGHITYIREEEKLARDVYLTLYDQYKSQIFANISESEQNHMDAIKGLIDKYGLSDPVQYNTVGMFTNQIFNELYIELVKKGRTNYCEALQVGIDIEVFDIKDIKLALEEVDADDPDDVDDVEKVFLNLLMGSDNHLNAFENKQEANNCELKNLFELN